MSENKDSKVPIPDVVTTIRNILNEMVQYVQTNNKLDSGIVFLNITEISGVLDKLEAQQGHLSPNQVKDIIDRYCTGCYHLRSNHFENHVRAIIQCKDCGHDEEYGMYCERRQF